MGFRTGRKYAITWCEKAEKAEKGWKGDSVKALECYDEAIKRDPTFAEPWYQKGKIFADSDELPSSWTWCHRISPYITGRPHPPYPEVGPMPNKLVETLKLFNKAVELDPKFVDAWFAKGNLYNGYTDSEQAAIICFDKVIALDPKYEKAWYMKAEVLSQLGRHKEVIKCCDKAIALLPEDAKERRTDGNRHYFSSRWRIKANALSELGKHKESLKCCDEALKIGPTESGGSVHTLSQKGITLAKLGKHEESLKCYDEATKADDYHGSLDSVKIDLAKADALSELGGPQERMLKCYSNAISSCAGKLVDDKRNPVSEYNWEKGVKKLQEICSQAINGLKKYNDYDEED